MKALALIASILCAAPAATRIADTQVYKATFDYYTLSMRGELTQRVQVSGTYTRSLDKKAATWRNVTVAGAEGAKPLGSAEQSPFMQGFSYRLGAPDMTSAIFFRDIPVTAMYERNLVFDARMWEVFGL